MGRAPLRRSRRRCYLRPGSGAIPATRRRERILLILGLESSCDDTGAAVIRAHPGAPVGEILASVVRGQDALHAAYGGVVPEIAARAHAERLDGVTETALAKAGVGLGQLGAVAVASGPGLIGGVLAGVMFAKGLALARGLPFWGVNHLAGHALTPRLVAPVAFPYLVLLVSGGHCQFLIVEGPDQFVRLGGTIDDAPGEAFDKIAKLLGLGQPGGPRVEAEARAGDPARFDLPRPLLDREGCDLSFSGLKTAVRRARDRLAAERGGITRTERADLCAGFQAAVAETLAEKTRRACRAFRARHETPTPTLAVAGGVAANGAIREALAAVADAEGFAWFAPPPVLCTDNGAIVAWAAAEAMAVRGPDALSLAARPRWPLDMEAAPMLGSGRKGAKA
ncbi:MAG: tRNA (adenosine(37)-N6)-threonylcarbamoyltransferase complex transferase subunit TsaD [Amaricoccus sp.]|nr:tRNA (adenosine(37)-N6)-threonylcarbamoyltransferase complex transferase subunit TsaD [Amaricoccus sp.]